MIFGDWHDPEIGWGPQPQEHLPGTILEGLRADPESWETSVKNGAGATQREWWGATPHLTMDGGLDAGWLGWVFLNELCRWGKHRLGSLGKGLVVDWINSERFPSRMNHDCGGQGMVKGILLLYPILGYSWKILEMPTFLNMLGHC